MIAPGKSRPRSVDGWHGNRVLQRLCWRRARRLRSSRRQPGIIPAHSCSNRHCRIGGGVPGPLADTVAVCRSRMTRSNGPRPRLARCSRRDRSNDSPDGGETSRAASRDVQTATGDRLRSGSSRTISDFAAAQVRLVRRRRGV